MSLSNLSDTMGDAQDYKGQWFLGTVVNDQDPTGAGRFQASVPGLFEDGELPWIGRMRPSPFGIGPGYGSFGTPHVGSSVIIELQRGDANYPMCIGFYPRVEDVPDVFKNGRVWGYRDPSGTTLIVNPDSKTYEFIHASGTTYTISEDGSLNATVVNNATVGIQGNATINVADNATINAGSNATINAGSNVLLQAAQAVIDAASTTVTGTLTVEGLLSVMAGITAKGDAGGGSSAVFEGNVEHTNGTFRSNGVSISDHRHDTTGPPIPGT